MLMSTFAYIEMSHQTFFLFTFVFSLFSICILQWHIYKGSFCSCRCQKPYHGKSISNCVSYKKRVCWECSKLNKNLIEIDEQVCEFFFLLFQMENPSHFLSVGTVASLERAWFIISILEWTAVFYKRWISISLFDPISEYGLDSRIQCAVIAYNYANRSLCVVSLNVFYSFPFYSIVADNAISMNNSGTFENLTFGKHIIRNIKIRFRGRNCSVIRE